jgi:hypothetical protein
LDLKISLDDGKKKVLLAYEEAIGFMCGTQGNIHVLLNLKRGGGGRKGIRKPPEHDYVIHG